MRMVMCERRSKAVLNGITSVEKRRVSDDMVMQQWDFLFWRKEVVR
jgi:hypothetical protein